MAEQPRLWGIDVIGGVYAVASLLLLFVVIVAPGAVKIFALIMMFFTVTFALGMFARDHSIRKFLVGMLYLAACMDLLVVVIYMTAFFNLINMPNKDPVDELLKVPTRFGILISMILYLRREDVRQAFAPVVSNSIDTPDPDEV